MYLTRSGFPQRDYKNVQIKRITALSLSLVSLPFSYQICQAHTYCTAQYAQTTSFIKMLSGLRKDLSQCGTERIIQHTFSHILCYYLSV